MGMSVGTGTKKGITPDINVTPLVDVVLVLLIIFMVVLPNVQDGKPIELFKAAEADKLSDGAEPIIVTIDRSEAFSLDEADMPRSNVLASLQSIAQTDRTRPLLLRADAGLPYKVVRSFFAEAQEVGFINISLAVGVSREWSEEEGG